MEAAGGLLRARESVRGVCVVSKGNIQPGLTGRLLYRAEDWRYLRGYDQDSAPAGGQDVDMRQRLLCLAKASASGLNRPLQQPTLQHWHICGGALSNDLDDLSQAYDRGYSKVKNCDPAILQSLGVAPTKMWSRMNDSGWSLHFQPKLQHDILVRNQEPGMQDRPLGCWWTVLARPQAEQGQRQQQQQQQEQQLQQLVPQFQQQPPQQQLRQPPPRESVARLCPQYLHGEQRHQQQQHKQELKQQEDQQLWQQKQRLRWVLRSSCTVWWLA